MPPEAQKSTKSNTTSSEKAAAKGSENDARKSDNIDSQTMTDTSDHKDTGDKIDPGDHDSQTAISTSATDTSDCNDTADKTDTGDRAAAVKIADTASDKTTVINSGVADGGDKTVVSDTNVAESGAELGRSPISTETSSVTEAGESRTAIQIENNEN